MGKATRALSKLKTTLRIALTVGTEAKALTLRSSKSRKVVPPEAVKVNNPRLLAASAMSTSDPVRTVNAVVPLTVTAPVPLCDKVPPVVRVRFPVTPIAPVV